MGLENPREDPPSLPPFLPECGTRACPAEPQTSASEAILSLIVHHGSQSRVWDGSDGDGHGANRIVEEEAGWRSGGGGAGSQRQVQGLGRGLRGGLSTPMRP